MKWFLYIVVLYWGDIGRYRHEMPSLELCRQAAKEMRYEANTGDENETAVAAYCATGEQERYYNATWWKDEEKDRR